MKFSRIYIEADAREHPKANTILARFHNAEIIACERYNEIFNPNQQSFRAQKQNPQLVLAIKRGEFVLPTPPGYTIGLEKNFYFSHMLNCLYDCRYCFLQGMYRSANYIVFVNFDDFKTGIDQTLTNNPDDDCFFFSGYDCDSLAMNGLTGFIEDFISFFADRPQAWLELRTKSINLRPLLEQKPIPNAVVAFSVNAEPIVEKLEHKTPNLHARLKAAAKLAKAGWKIGLRFDPLVYHPNAEENYRSSIQSAFEQIPEEQIHSITLGTFRSPSTIFKRMESLYPEEPLFMSRLKNEKGSVSYEKEIDEMLITTVREELEQHTSKGKIFHNQ